MDRENPAPKAIQPCEAIALYGFEKKFSEIAGLSWEENFRFYPQDEAIGTDRKLNSRANGSEKRFREKDYGGDWLEAQLRLG